HARDHWRRGEVPPLGRVLHSRARFSVPTLRIPLHPLLRERSSLPPHPKVGRAARRCQARGGTGRLAARAILRELDETVSDVFVVGVLGQDSLEVFAGHRTLALLEVVGCPFGQGQVPYGWCS